jgi:hypothetical protein
MCTLRKVYKIRKHSKYCKEKQDCPCGVTAPRSRLILSRRINNMETVKKIDKRIDVEQLKKRFHIIAAHPPRFNPFTFEGREAFEAWGESCRQIESELRDAGEVL